MVAEAAAADLGREGAGALECVTKAPQGKVARGQVCEARGSSGVRSSVCGARGKRHWPASREGRHSAQWVVTQVRVARETSRTVACARNLLLVLWCTLLY